MRSLFSKLLIINISVILVGFIILGLTMSNTLEDYFIRQKEELLLEQAEIIAEEYLSAFGSGLVNLNRFSFELEALDRYLDARIWMISRTGQVYVNSGFEGISDFIKDMDLDEIREVLQGNIVRREGTFRGYFQEPVLTIGYPIMAGEDVLLGLFIHASIPEIQRTALDIRRITIISLVISFNIAFTLIFLTSRNLTKEIRRINNGVRDLAKGNFHRRLSITRRDELGELAANFNSMAEDLSQLEELRRNFISNVSHDLRSPLTSINGFIEGILDGTIGKEDQERYLRKVLQESRRLNKLTNDILDLSKIESGQMELTPATFDIHQVILHQLDQFEKRIGDKEIRIYLQLSDQRFKAYGDPHAIERVLYNLLDNAIKFTHQGGHIGISTFLQGDRVLVRIRNSGDVIPEDRLKGIFDRFNKLDDSRGQDKEGSGLGLAIVKELVKAHGQEIWVRSQETFGVEFAFTLDAFKES